jgi:hypothetical protein
MKKLAFFIYSWGSSILFISLTLWLASIPDFKIYYGDIDFVFKVGFRITLYMLLFVLIYRSFITTLKNAIKRLSKWRSKREQHEDAEFVIIIETMVVIATLFMCTTVALIDQWIQSRAIFFKGDQYITDLFVSVFGIITAAIIVYILPSLGELEYAVKHRFEEVFGKRST